MAVATRGAESSTVQVGFIGGGLSLRPGDLGRRRECRVEPKQLAGTLALTCGGGAEESVAADLLKAFGEDVLEKARDEGVDGQGEMSCLGP
jgi:hypothetical protein